MARQRRARADLLIASLFFILQSFALLGAINFIPVSLAILLFYLFPILVMLGSSLLGEKSSRPSRWPGRGRFRRSVPGAQHLRRRLDWRGVALESARPCALP